MIRIFTILFLFITLTATAIDNNVALKNELKKKAETAFKNKQYAEAIKQYKILTDSLAVTTPNIYLNIAHAYFNLKNHKEAATYYQKVIDGNSPTYASIAWNQLGKLKIVESKIELTKNNYASVKPEQIEIIKKGQTDFKQALKTNPQNTTSRYNYEAVTKWLNNMPEDKKKEQDQHEKEQEKKEEQKKQEEEKKKEQEQKEDQNKDSKDEKKDQEGKKDDKDKDSKDPKDSKDSKEEGKKDEQNKDGKPKEDKKGDPKDKKEGDDKKGEEKKEPGKEGDKKKENQSPQEKSAEQKKQEEAKQKEAQLQQRLQEQNLSKEKALQLLNSIDQQEKKYLQQMERKDPNQNSNNNNKPDW